MTALNTSTLMINKYRDIISTVQICSLFECLCPKQSEHPILTPAFVGEKCTIELIRINVFTFNYSTVCCLSDIDL